MDFWIHNGIGHLYTANPNCYEDPAIAFCEVALQDRRFHQDAGATFFISMQRSPIV